MKIGKPLLHSDLTLGEEVLGSVAIWRPKKRTTKYGAEFWCYYQITGFGFDEIQYAIGSDNMQSMVLAIQAIGTNLKNSDLVKAKKLNAKKNWNNFGFPSFDV